jgi:aminopeptidase N
VLLAFLLVALVFASSSALAATPVASPIAAELEPVLPEYQQPFAELMRSIPTYELELALDDAQSTISGQMVVTFPNETGLTIDTLPFRLYPNARYYGEGETSIDAIAIDGAAVAPRFDDSATVLFVDLPSPLGPGESIAVTIDFSTVVPQNTGGSFGILNHDLTAEKFVLADWYPIVAGWDETGWRLEPPTDQGDPTFSVTSLYDVRLSVPEGYEVIATGDESRQADGALRIETGPVREFALVVAQGLQVISGQSGDTTVSVHADPAHRANGQHMLEVAISALDFYNDAFGPYPFRELDIVETNLSLAYGVSWSGVLFINETQLDLASGNLATLDFTLFHEIGHQWWGAAIGANSNDHTFMVEGLTNATAVLAQAAVQGPDAAATSLYGWMVTPYLNLLAGSGDAVADMSIFDQPATAPLSTLAYGKGGLGFLAIRNQIGNEAFMAALAAYADAFRLGIAEPDDLLAAFEAASGQSLQELWSFWFDSATTTPADIEALVPQIIASL